MGNVSAFHLYFLYAAFFRHLECEFPEMDLLAPPVLFGPRFMIAWLNNFHGPVVAIEHAAARQQE